MISFLYNKFRAKKFERLQSDVASDLKDMYDAERQEGDRRLSVSRDALDALEKKSGIVIDSDGRCLCRKCGHSLSAVFDHCISCNAGIKWDA